MEEIEKKLYEHQKEAIKVALRYSKSKSKGSCLINMPTGTGKSGVITMISQFYLEKKTILVLTPRVSLTEQIKDDIKWRFLKNGLKIENFNNPKKVIDLESTILNKDISNLIIVSTIQRLRSIEKNEEELFKQLAKKIDLVIFDEGHYEPAISWSKTVRVLCSRRILFTATPYRNDFKFFDVDQDHIYSFRYKEAAEQRIVREVSFIQQNYNKQNFVKNYWNLFSKEIPKIEGVNLKGIIRCRSFKSINRIHEELKQYSKSIISVHERFNHADYKLDNLKIESVPRNIDKRDETIWIHQYKLLEGIDDERFIFLGFYESLSNSRAFIQQIGRIIRNSKLNQNIAYVLDKDKTYKSIWDRYLEFDKEISSIKSFIPLSKVISETLDNKLPAYDYIDKDFRRQFKMKDLIPRKDLKLPKKVSIININNDFNLSDFIQYYIDYFTKMDYAFVLKTGGFDLIGKLFDIQDYKNSNFSNQVIYVFYYLTKSNTPFLHNKYSFNLRNELILFFLENNNLFFYSSEGQVPINKEEICTSRPIERNKIYKFFEDSKNIRIVNVSLKNSNIGQNSIRSKTIGARSLEDTLTYLDDPSQIINSSAGKYYKKVKVSNDKDEDEEVTKVIQRYISLNKGRFSEGEEYVDLEEYYNWVREVGNIINSKNNPSAFFNRYSTPIDVVKDPSPRHILIDIDIDEIQSLFRSKTIKGNEGQTIVSENQILDFDDLSSEIKGIKPVPKEYPIYSFYISLYNGALKYNASIQFKESNGIFHFECEELDKNFAPTTDNYSFDSITNYINQNQSFRIITRNCNIIYAYNSFFKAGYNYGEKLDVENFNPLRVLYTYEILNKINSEKGRKTDGEKWEVNSLFGLVSRSGVDKFYNDEMKTEFLNFDIIICDDLQTEIADFIMADTKGQRVVFVHAKAKGTKALYSASKLSDVISQALKNINYLSMTYKNTPKANIKKWEAFWDDGENAKNVNGIAKRIINSETQDTKIIWNKIRSIISNPNANREVWLLLGNMFSKSEFKKALTKKRPVYEAVQASILIDDLIQQVGTIDAKLKIMCGK